jgi:hypothetical protein
MRFENEKPRPADRTGLCGKRPSVAVRLAAGPDEGEGLGIFVVEEVGVNRSVEARIVELDREIIAALAGALRPGGSDLGATDVDPVARCVLVGLVSLGDWNSWPDFLNEPMLAMSLLLAVSEPATTAASMAI